MEIKFEVKTVNAFKECFHQMKRTQISLESVVPDVCDDIGRLFSVQPCILLKSKDLTSHGVSVTGELSVVLLYVNELENKVFDLHMTQGFSLEYELPDLESDTQTQVRLFVGNSDARALNPRKVSVTIEICGELFGYHQEATAVESSLPEPEDLQIYTKTEKTNAMIINAVCEKTFVVNEQFTFSGGRAAPERLISSQVSFRTSDCQMIGSKILIKGSVDVSTCYLPVGSDCPSDANFTVPFSQLIETGQESMDACSVRIEPTSVYFALIDTIGGEKALDTEIHAVAQIVSRFQQTIMTVSDAYCAQMPSALSFDRWRFASETGPERLTLVSEEKIELPEDCVDLLAVYPTLGQSRIEMGRAEAGGTLDILYRSAGGTLSSVRRSFSTEAECREKGAVLCDARISDHFFRPDGDVLTGNIQIELDYLCTNDLELPNISAVELNEDAPYDPTRFPTFTAVRVDRESVWDLAKAYHSSSEQIEALNRIEGPIRGHMLLIPKCI